MPVLRLNNSIILSSSVRLGLFSIAAVSLANLRFTSLLYASTIPSLVTSRRLFTSPPVNAYVQSKDIWLYIPSISTFVFAIALCAYFIISLMIDSISAVFFTASEPSAFIKRAFTDCILDSSLSLFNR